MTPSAGKCACDTGIARLIARHGEETVKRSIERVTTDPKWKLPIEKLRREIYGEDKVRRPHDSL